MRDVDWFQLVTVVTRILSFPVTSPVMKFVTGLEVLLQKAQVRKAISQLTTSLRESDCVFTCPRVHG